MTGVTSLWRGVLLCGLVALFAGTALAGVFSLIQAAPAGSGEWEVQGIGLGGASVYALAVNPQITDTLYAGVDFGIYKSSDGGAHWVNSTNNMLTWYGDVPLINSIAVHPALSSTLYAASVGGGGVFKSLDGGQSWAAANDGITTLFVDTVVIDPQNPAVLYAGTMGNDSKGGIFKSVNNAQTWAAANTGLPIPAYVTSLAFDPQNSSVIYAVLRGAGIYKSTNAGESWTPINEGLFVKFGNDLVIDPQTPTTIYLATQDMGVMKSTNGGVTFEGKAEGMDRLNITALWLADSGTIYAGTENGGVFTSSDAAESWAPNTAGLTSSYIQALAGHPAVVYAGTMGGVYKITGQGVSWVEANSGLPAVKVEALLLLPAQPRPLVAGSAGGGIYGYQNRAWVSSSTGIANTWIRSLAEDPAMPTTLYAGTFFGGLYKSIDGGLSWSEKSTGLPSMGEKGSEVREILVHPITPTIVYVGVPPLASYLPGGVFKSEDGGEHWVRTSEGMSYSNEDILSLAMDTSNPDVMYAGMIFDGVYKTTDGGANWSPANQGLPQQYRTVRELAVDPKQPSVVYAGLEGRLYRSANGGATWNPTSLEQTVTAMVFDPAASGTIYVGTEGWGVSRSVDGGGTWENLTMLGSASGRAYVYDLEYDARAHTLVAATMNGVEFGLDSPNRLGGSRLSAYVVNSYGVYALCFTQTCPPIGAYTVFIPAVSR